MVHVSSLGDGVCALLSMICPPHTRCSLVDLLPLAPAAYPLPHHLTSPTICDDASPPPVSNCTLPHYDLLPPYRTVT